MDFGCYAFGSYLTSNINKLNTCLQMNQTFMILILPVYAPLKIFCSSGFFLEVGSYLFGTLIVGTSISFLYFSFESPILFCHKCT
jgi:hypothetical protein